MKRLLLILLALPFLLAFTPGDWDTGTQTDFLRLLSDEKHPIELVGDATVWEDMRIPGLATKLGASAPDLVGFGPSGNLQCLGFAGTATDEQVFFAAQMPHTWAHTSIEAHVHWTPTTADAGNVQWHLEYSFADIDGTFGAPTTISSDTGAAGTAWKHTYTDFSTLIAAPSATGISAMIVGRLFRTVADADDTYEADACMLEFDFHYEISTLGSREEDAY